MVSVALLLSANVSDGTESESEYESEYEYQDDSSWLDTTENRDHGSLNGAPFRGSWVVVEVGWCEPPVIPPLAITCFQ